MKRFMVVCAVICQPYSSTAQSFPLERLSDWEFRFHACKNAVRQVPAVVRLMRSQGLNGLQGVEVLRTETGPLLAAAILENERGVKFSEGEAAFVSDLTFTLVGGMIAGGLELTETQLLRSGLDLCNSAIGGL